MIGDRCFKFLLRFPILKWWVSVTCQPSPDGNFSSLRTNTDLFSWRKHTTTSTSLQITRVFFASYVQLCPAMSSSSLSFRLSMTEKTRNQVPQLTFQWNNSSKCHSQKKKCHSFQKNRPASNRLNTKSELDLIHQSPPVSTRLHPGAQCDSWDPPWLRPCNAKGPASAPGAEWNSDRAASFPHTRNGYLLHSELENDGTWPSRNSEFSVFPLKMVIFHSYVTVYQRVSSNETSVTGWWYTYPSEKNMTSSIGIIIPNWMEK